MAVRRGVAEMERRASLCNGGPAPTSELGYRHPALESVALPPSGAAVPDRVKLEKISQSQAISGPSYAYPVKNQLECATPSTTSMYATPLQGFPPQLKREKDYPAPSEPSAYVGSQKDTLHWNDALAILNEGAVKPRPSRIGEEVGASVQMFLEAPVLRRRKGDDKWTTSGGCKGSTEHWFTDDTGLLKRYGRIVRADGCPLKFTQYTMLRARAVASGEREVFQDLESVALWVVRPIACAPEHGGRQVHPDSPNAVPAGGHPLQTGALEIFSERKFISFREHTASNPGHSIELGQVVRGCDGVKLTSRQGDFAEYHRRADGEPPFEEGDVVGFRRGVLTRRTINCSMLGIVSRKAVVEGSAPPQSERHLYETVAYNGIVPVKLSLSASTVSSSAGCDCSAVPEQGQLLVPSGKHDGTAVLASADSGLDDRVGIMLDECSDLISKPNSNTPSANYRLVNAVVVTPAETVRTDKKRSGATRKLMALIWLMATTTVGVSLLNNLDLATSREILCTPFSSTHNISQLAGYTVRNADARSVGDLGLKCAVSFSGAAHVECLSHQGEFGQVSGCVANSCSVDLGFNIASSKTSPPSPVIQNRGTFAAYLLGRDNMQVVVSKRPDGQKTWRTDPPYITAAELSMTCDLGFTETEAPTAVCVEEHGKFTTFRGCQTTDVCAMRPNNDRDPQIKWELQKRCLSLQDQFSLNTTRNREVCVVDENCEFCTQTELGVYCMYN